MKIIKKPLAVLLAIIVGTSLFYWFQLRPSNIKKECHKFIIDKVKDIPSIEQANFAYTMCLHKNGL
jgi:uncharacterized membrane protein